MRTSARRIDFLEFYAREALRLAEATTPIQFPGERNQLRYIPLGVGAVHSAVELPVRDHGRHDRGGDRLRQHGGPEAVESTRRRSRRAFLSCSKRLACPMAS